MARKIARKVPQQQRGKRGNQHQAQYEQEPQMDVTPHRQPIDRTPVSPKTDNQRRYINAIRSQLLTFATGPAGTGKTWLVTALAAEMLDKGEVDKIIITRPAVEAGEEMGFLPGEIEDKFDPYLTPFREVLNERMGKSKVEYMLKVGRIEAAPLAYMRGRTFKNAFVILDEGQNTTPGQMKMFLTRIGEDCKVVVNGDVKQKDIRGDSGLADAVRRLSYIPSVTHIEFTRKDIVRSGLVQEIVECYDRTENELKTMVSDA